MDELAKFNRFVKFHRWARISEANKNKDTHDFTRNPRLERKGGRKAMKVSREGEAKKKARVEGVVLDCTRSFAVKIRAHLRMKWKSR